MPLLLLSPLLMLSLRKDRVRP
jgi:hypothetical protein